MGNFVNRALVLNQKYYNGEVPTRGELTQQDKDVLVELEAIPKKLQNFYTSIKLEKPKQKQ
jgi:hypothetical protein